MNNIFFKNAIMNITKLYWIWRYLWSDKNRLVNVINIYMPTSNNYNLKKRRYGLYFLVSWWYTHWLNLKFHVLFFHCCKKYSLLLFLHNLPKSCSTCHWMMITHLVKRCILLNSLFKIQNLILWIALKLNISSIFHIRKFYLVCCYTMYVENKY